MKMRRQSFPVRSWDRASRKSLDPSTASLPGEANERFGSGVSTRRCDPQCDSGNADVEIVPDTFDERDVPHKKRHCLGTSETGRGRLHPLNLDACIVCDVSDEQVSRCSGIGCILSFHGVCLNHELGKSDDHGNAYCPYCWFKILALKHKTATEKAVVAEKAVSKYLDKEIRSGDEAEESVPKSQEDTTLYCDENGNHENSMDSTDIVSDHELRGEKDACSSEKEQVQVEKDSDKSREEDTPLIEETDYQPEEDTEKLYTDKSGDMKEDKGTDGVEASEDEGRRVDTEKLQDSEEDEDDKTAKDQTKVNTGAGEKGDVSPSLSIQKSVSGKEVQQNEEQGRRRRRRLILNDIDSEISSSESTNDSLSGKMKKQQRKHSATTKTKVAQSNTVRDISFFKSNQRRRLLWTSEEEEMLKVGVEKFAAEAKKNMPWRKILEMGEKVFHETRAPADLKDKWRNMNGGRLGKKTN